MAAITDRIWDLARAFQPSRVLLTGVELGIFGQLGDVSKTSVEVAKEINADPRATDRLMNALVALGLLTKEDDQFSNQPEVREVLVPGKPGYMGGALMHTAHLWINWSTLTDAVRAGTAVAGHSAADSPDRARAFMAAMHHIASAQADTIVSLIDLSKARRMIDIGGGSGAYSIAFCRTNPDLESVVFDQPQIVPITKEYVEQAGMSGRITTHTGNFNRDDLPGGFDLAFLSQIMHSNSPQENMELAKKVYGALNPSGQIVIQEFVIDESRAWPLPQTLFALNMLVGTEAGDTYTESEITDWLRSAGFTNTARINPPTNTTLIIAKKPN